MITEFRFEVFNTRFNTSLRLTSSFSEQTLCIVVQAVREYRGNLQSETRHMPGRPLTVSVCV
jgi:hypothetical protein